MKYVPYWLPYVPHRPYSVMSVNPVAKLVNKKQKHYIEEEVMFQPIMLFVYPSEFKQWIDPPSKRCLT